MGSSYTILAGLAFRFSCKLSGAGYPELSLLPYSRKILSLPLLADKIQVQRGEPDALLFIVPLPGKSFSIKAAASGLGLGRPPVGYCVVQSISGFT